MRSQSPSTRSSPSSASTSSLASFAAVAAADAAEVCAGFRASCCSTCCSCCSSAGSSSLTEGIGSNVGRAAAAVGRELPSLRGGANDLRLRAPGCLVESAFTATFCVSSVTSNSGSSASTSSRSATASLTAAMTSVSAMVPFSLRVLLIRIAACDALRAVVGGSVVGSLLFLGALKRFLGFVAAVVTAAGSSAALSASKSEAASSPLGASPASTTKRPSVPDRDGECSRGIAVGPFGECCCTCVGTTVRGSSAASSAIDSGLEEEGWQRDGLFRSTTASAAREGESACISRSLLSATHRSPELAHSCRACKQEALNGRPKTSPVPTPDVSSELLTCVTQYQPLLVIRILSYSRYSIHTIAPPSHEVS